MAYDYIKRFYGVNPVRGQRVRHQVTNKVGTICQAAGDPQYVSVRFDDRSHSVPCHPTELDYLAEDAG